MPKCVKCNEYLPPNYVEVIPGSEPMFDGEYPKECIFCKLIVSEVQRETENGSGKFVTYTKKQCLEDYKAFIDKLYKSRDLQGVVDKGGIIV